MELVYQQTLYFVNANMAMNAFLKCTGIAGVFLFLIIDDLVTILIHHIMTYYHAHKQHEPKNLPRPRFSTLINFVNRIELYDLKTSNFSNCGSNMWFCFNSNRKKCHYQQSKSEGTMVPWTSLENIVFLSQCLIVVLMQQKSH